MTVSLDEFWEKIGRAMERRREDPGQLDDLAVQMLRDPAVNALPDGMFAAAYCKYAHPRRVESPEIQEQFLEIASQVFALSPNHQRMRLLVGFHHFDLGDFQAAQESFQKVDEGGLPDDDRVKMRELVLCIALQGLDLPTALPLVESFVDEALEENEYDVFPTHLLAWVDEQCHEAQASSAARKRLREAIERLLIGIRQENVFPDTLERLRSWGQETR